MRGATIHSQDNRIVALVDVEGTLRTNRGFTFIRLRAWDSHLFSFGELFFRPDKVEVHKFAYEGSTPTQLFTGFAQMLTRPTTKRANSSKARCRRWVESWTTTVAQNAAVHTLERLLGLYDKRRRERFAY